MFGNKAKSKPKALKIDDSAAVASDGNGRKDDSSIEMEIPLAEEQMIEETPGFIVSDGLEEKAQNVLEDNDHEKDVVTEINGDRTEDVCTQDGTIDEERINTDNPNDDEAPLKFDNNDVSIGDDREATTDDVSANKEGSGSDHGLTENMTDNLENHKEPSVLDAEEPVGASNEVMVVTGKVNTTNKKVVKRKWVRKNAVNKEMPEPSDKHTNIEEKASDINHVSVGEANNNEHVSNEEEAEGKPSVTVNKKRKRNRRKKAPQDQSGVATVKGAQKPQSKNDKFGSEEHIAINEPNLKNEKVENLGDKASSSKRNTKKKIVEGSREMVSKDGKKPEGKSAKKVDSMGMIFMCSSETKKDCYRYKVLGLPASKKDMVLKIYKGMRLFLFDVDLRMMYGIYKATGPGGYNIESRAFKSKFPAQVRFSVLKDCVPVAEEKFRNVLKDNYYSKNKFNFQLNNEQVKNLCKLFHETGKKAESTKEANKTQRAGARPFTSSVSRRDNKRKRVEDSHRRVVAPRPPPLEWERAPRRTYEELRLAPVVISDRYHHERPTYVTETYVPSVAPVPVYQPLPAPRSPPSRTYSYNRVSAIDPYRRETVIDPRDLAASRDSRLRIDPYRRDSRETVIDPRDLAPSRDSRLPIERSHYDSYLSYREAPQVYSAQTYSSGTRTVNYDYGSSDARYAEYYRTAEYRPPPSLPLYRRY